MTRLRIWSSIGLALMTLAGTALAQPARIATGSIPEHCREFLSVPRDSRSVTLPWEQQLSLAACRQSFTLTPTSNAADFPGVISKINQAMDPSIAIYRDAARRGPTPQLRMLANYGLGMTYINSMVRARNAVVMSNESLSGTDPYQQLHQPMESLLGPYRDGAVMALDEVGRLAKENPAATGNPVIAFIVTDAKTTANAVRSSTELPTPSVSRR